MMRRIQQLVCLAVVLSGAALAQAFSLIGPFEAWQVTAIGFQRPGDIGGPKDINEGYRWNLPVITYAFDQSFVLYFGPAGMAAVDSAISLLNSLPPFSDIQDDGTSLYINGDPVPLYTRKNNNEAQTLGLMDVKSYAMSLLLEEMGLAQPERWAWTIYSKHTETVGGQDYTNYTVRQYNYSPVGDHHATPIVNGTYYTYKLTLYPLAAPPFDDMVEAPVGLFPYSSVAGFGIYTFNTGEFFPSLTQDDIGGLRWLYHRDRLVVENLITNAILGQPIGGGSPWLPFFTSTNFITPGTTATNAAAFVTNVLTFQALRPGINKLQFQRVNYDSLLGNRFNPFTNYWTDTYLSNGVMQLQPAQRVITQPDILFVVDDLGVFALSGLPVIAARSGTGNWQNNDPFNGADGAVDGGPGVIQGPVSITFSRLLPYFENYLPYYVSGIGGNTASDDETAASPPSMIWGSFDATTNAPVIFPAYGRITLDDLRAYAVQGGTP
jgi:hypothetical protein